MASAALCWLEASCHLVHTLAASQCAEVRQACVLSWAEEAKSLRACEVLSHLPSAEPAALSGGALLLQN